MSTVLEQIPLGASAVLIRLRSLGDCVLTTPALRLLKGFRPDLQIAVVVEDRFRAVFQGNPDVSATLAPTRGAISAWKPGLCVNLHGGTRSLVLTLASRAKFTAGFGHYRASWLYGIQIPRAQEILGEERVVHTAEHLASAMFYLGVPRTEIPRAKIWSGEGPDRRAYVVLHPFASAPEKAWPVERFVEIARLLKQRYDLDPIFIGAEGDDFTPYSEFECRRGAPLEEIKSLLFGASLFVGNDSGPAHLAAALQVATVVLFGASDPVVWAPWKAHAEQIVAERGLATVTAQDVFEAVERLNVRA